MTKRHDHNGRVMVRRIGEPRDKAVPLAEIRLREWERQQDERHEHQLLALRLGAPVTAGSYTGELWWFVADVNGIERRITGKTVMFDLAQTKSFSFDMIEPYELKSADEDNEANLCRRRLGLPEIHFGAGETDGIVPLDLAA